MAAAALFVKMRRVHRREVDAEVEAEEANAETSMRVVSFASYDDFDDVDMEEQGREITIA